ncbi:uncharacterized protein BYT42DRAFT_592845 [Radiomyces spectabilis]|uniref:uncharacterized protein n=1 Tax=Radiomyces spectabilis TaxID=64574 RepID=UPI00221F2449|nr:uncharacterized protein BYT42DRAFT_592845 [Radiomyces spectabilis]KAI8384756.1 hypothetical protein BYT42DRAFT_592845 [Radiomyces spectabilis]
MTDAINIKNVITHSLFTKELDTNGDEPVKTVLSIVHVLREARCCYRCCLRFIGSITMEDYTASEQWIDRVCEELEKHSYKATAINMNAELPVSNMHRDHLLWIHVGDQLALEHHDIRDLKNPFRHILGKCLTSRTGLSMDPEAPLRMNIIIQHEPSASEHLFLTQAQNPVLKIRKVRQKRVWVTAGDGRPVIRQALNAIDADDARSLTAIPPLPVDIKPTLASIALMHASCFVAARYIKLSREYSQTPWVIKGKRLTEHSVSDCIAPVVQRYHRSDAYKFTTAGREDANVRMLGTGRPFYIEVINPRTPSDYLSKEDFEKMESEINQAPETKEAVQIRHLTKVQPGDIEHIKQGEEFKQKTYRALIWMSDVLTDERIAEINVQCSKPFKILQNTPVRVFQRRSAAIREKDIHYFHLERLPATDAKDPANAHFAVLTLTTGAGAYVKEFVHGDLGRTQPNLATIAQIKSADLIELDVLHVDLEWPPNTPNPPPHIVHN